MKEPKKNRKKYSGIRLEPKKDHNQKALIPLRGEDNRAFGSPAQEKPHEKFPGLGILETGTNRVQKSPAQEKFCWVVSTGWRIKINGTVCVELCRNCTRKQ